jgi:hypothetical protein
MPFCPFCGVFSEFPHKTQEVCIDALNREIARMRELLGQLQSAAVPGTPDHSKPVAKPSIKQVKDDSSEV